MTYIIIWFISGIVYTATLRRAVLFTRFSIISFFSLIKIKEGSPLWFYLITPAILLFAFTTPPLISILTSIAFTCLIVLTLKTSHPNLKLSVVFFLLLKRNLIYLIKARETIYIRDRPLRMLKKRVSLASLILLLLVFVIYSSYRDFFILAALIFTLCTTYTTGILLRFGISMISLNFLSPLIELKHPYKPSLVTSLSRALKSKIDNHPLKATIQEDFFEDNLQRGDFYLAYPLFFKVSTPEGIKIDPNVEKKNIWHLVRWESALSKQTGSAASRWRTIFDFKTTHIKRRVHRIHTPLIPVFSDQLYSDIVSQGLVCFNPFNQAPFWRPYIILTEFLGWDKDEVKEERLNEIEEEDWQCSLNRTLSLHLSRGSPPQSHSIWW